MLGTIIWAIIVGAILGYVGRLLLPGRQNIPAWATIVAGIVAALVGGWVASWFGWDHMAGIDWWKLLLQVIFAVIAVYITARIMGGRSGTTSRRM